MWKCTGRGGEVRQASFDLGGWDYAYGMRLVSWGNVKTGSQDILTLGGHVEDPMLDSYALFALQWWLSPFKSSFWVPRLQDASPVAAAKKATDAVREACSDKRYCSTSVRQSCLTIVCRCYGQQAQVLAVGGHAHATGLPRAFEHTHLWLYHVYQSQLALGDYNSCRRPRKYHPVPTLHAVSRNFHNMTIIR